MRAHSYRAVKITETPPIPGRRSCMPRATRPQRHTSTDRQTPWAIHPRSITISKKYKRGRSRRTASGAAGRGHGRWDARRLFHEVAVSVRDVNGGLSASRCELFHAWTVPVFNTTTNVTTIEWKSAPATTRRERDEESDARATMHRARDLARAPPRTPEPILCGLKRERKRESRTARSRRALT